MTELLIGLDLGTSAVKGLLVSSDGAILAREKVATEYTRPGLGRVEFSADGHFELVCDCIRKLSSKIPGDGHVVGLSMAAASGNALLLDPEDKPLGNAISWMDMRAGKEYKDLLEPLGIDTIYETVGWPGIPAFPLTQFLWKQRNEPEVFKKAGRKIMQLTYIFYRLTGEWGVDRSTASTYYLQNQVEKKWHAPFLEAVELEESSMPRLMDSGSVLGALSGRVAEKTGLAAGTKVVLGAFDHPCAARGVGVFEPGDMLLSCGTSWVGLFPHDDRSLAVKNSMLIDSFLRDHGPWLPFFSIPSVGIAVDWFVDNVIAKEIAPGAKYDCFGELARSSPAGANGLIINPTIPNPENPEQEKAFKGRSTGEIARALMEGLAFEVKAKMEALSLSGVSADRITMVGGPSESKAWPQIVADATGLSVSLLNGQTAGAMGAAILAGVGAGIFRDEKDGFTRIGGRAEILAPGKDATKRYQDIYYEYVCSQHSE